MIIQPSALDKDGGASQLLGARTKGSQPCLTCPCAGLATTSEGLAAANAGSEAKASPPISAPLGLDSRLRACVSRPL